MAKNQLGWLRLLLVMCALMATSVLAQETPSETPTATVVETATETPTDAPIVLVTEEPAPFPTASPTETPTLAEPTLETPTSVPTEVVMTPVATLEPTTATGLPAEPELTLVIRDLFQDAQGVGVLSGAWTMPFGWALTSVAGGTAVQIDAAVAGLTSSAHYQDAYGNVAAMGYFTFESGVGAAQLIVRESAAGSYSASLDASGTVTLSRQDASGEVVAVLGTAFAPAADINAARSLRVSVLGDVLRVAVDDVEVIAIQDTTMLPVGSIRVAVTFPAPLEGQSASGVVLFDNFFVWLPTGEAPIVTPTVEPSATASEPTATEPAVIVITEAPTEPTVIATQEIVPTEPTVIATQEIVLTVIVTEESSLPTEPTVVATEEIAAPVEPTVIATEESTALPMSAPFGPMATNNDNFANITTVAAVPYANTGDTTNNTKETGEPSPLATCGGSLIGGTAWYKFTPAATASYIIGTRGSSFDTVFQIYASAVASPTFANLIAATNGCSDDAPGLGAQSQLTLTLTAGKTYYIQVGGLNNRQGLLNFYVARPPDAVIPAAPVISVVSAVNPNGGLANVGFTSDSTPRLAWTSAFAAPFYEVEISSLTTFAAGPNTTRITTPDRFVEPGLNLGNRVYYWRVRAQNHIGQVGAYSAVYRFTLDTVPPAPVTTLTAPAVNAVVLARPVFSWGAVAGVKYRLEIDTNAFDADPAPLKVPNLVTPAVALTTSLAQGDYRWRVVTVDAAGNETTSAERTFIVDYRKDPTADKIIFAPTTGATANTARVPFTWTPAPGVPTTVRYTIEIDTDADQDADIILTPTSNTSTATTATSDFLPLKTYHYRLVSNTQGTTAWRRFFVSNTLPAAPVLAALTATNNTRPTFTWTAVTGITTYDVDYGTSATFAAGSTTHTTVVDATTFTVPADPDDLPDTPGTTYYVRVRGVNSVGAFTGWSLVRSFLLDTVGPAPLTTLTAPANNAVVSTGRPAFSWPAAAGAVGYRFLISRDSTDFDLLEIAPAPTVGTSAYTIPASTPFLKQGRYVWTAAVRDALGNISANNPVRTLDVNYATMPTANQVYVLPNKVTFKWTLPAAGRAYKIEVDSNGDGNPDSEFLPTTATGTSIANVTFAVGAYRYRLVHTTDADDVSDWRPFFVVGGPALAAPALAQPLAATSDTTPVFSWTLGAGQTQDDFELQLATNAAFTSALTITAQNLTPTAGVFSAVVPDLNALPATSGTTYYVRVRSLNPVGAPSPYSLVRTFVLDTQAPAPLAALTAPANNAVVSQPRPVFGWPAAPVAQKANGYVFQLSRVADFSTLVFTNEIIVATTSYMLPASLPYLTQGTYYWRVLPKDAANNRISDVAQTVENTFTVNYALTPTNNQVLPPAAATPNQTHVKFTWSPVPATNPAQTGIQVQIATDSAFANIVKTSPNLPASAITYTTSLAGSTPNTNPLPVGQYVWRIVVTGHGTPAAEVYRTFAISGTQAAPTLIYPPVSPVALTNDPTPTITWQALANVSGFELSYSTTSTFTPATTVIVPIASGSATSYTITPALPATAGTNYYVRLRAKNAQGVFSAFSTPRRFALDTVAPTTAPTLTSPANNVVVATLKPTLVWTPVAGAVRYNVFYSSHLNELDAVVPYTAATTRYVPLSNLIPGTYYWRVQGVDAAGNAGPLSATLTFKVNTVPSGAPTAWNYTTSTPTLTWSALTWAIKYQIDISRTPAFVPTDIVWAGESVDSAPTVTTGPLINGTYYWRVRGVASETQVGKYSAIESFTVDVAN